MNEEIVTQVSKEVFKETKGTSYSRLSKLANGPKAYQAALADDSTSSAMALGTAVDIKLTEPERFDEEIYVMSVKKPTAEMMVKFVNGLVNNSGNTAIAWTQSGFKIGIDAVMKKFDKEGGREYHDALLAAGDRQVLDIEDLFKVNQIVSTLQNNPFTKKYFIPEDGVDLIFQPCIIWDLAYVSLVEDKMKTIVAKSMLDVIRVDHRNKIIQPVDLKTGGEGFMKSYWRYKRYLQGAMYTQATYKATWDKEEIGEQYEIDNMRFIYADTNLFNPPVIYKMTDDDVHVGTNGKLYRTFGNNSELNQFGYIKDNWKTKGYTQLAAELEWHIANDQWEYSYDVYKKNGEIDINSFVIKF